MVVCDLHTDTVYRVRRGFDILKRNKGPINIYRLKKGNIKLIVFACWVKPDYQKPFSLAMELVERIWQIAEQSDGKINIVTKKKDLNLDRLNVIIGVEGGHIFEENLFAMDALFRVGVRIFTTTWNNSNSLAHSALEDDKRGLTRKGKKFIKEIENLGGIIDLSHSSTKTVIDCCNVVSKPVIASHSCVRSLNPIMRNISDEAISAIAQNGGIIGINLSRHHLGESSFYDHVDYLLQNYGHKLLAFGSDFDGIDDAIIKDCSQVPKLLQGLVDKGISQNKVEALACKNFLRVFKKCVS